MDLRSKLYLAIRDQKTLPWLPEFTEDLANSAWRTLCADSGFTRQNYSTSRIIGKDIYTERNILGALVFDDFKGELILEKLAGNIETEFGVLGLCFPQTDQCEIEYQLSELNLAFDIISEIPSLYITVLTLVRSIHILKAENDQHDVSFSDPEIPFSIFISMPSVHETNSSIRLAEAIIHEAMHLQLTLIETFSPLILEDNKKLFSPWKNEDRRPSGIFHALYVFSVIYTSLPLLNTLDKQFVARRRLEIKKQILEIYSFRFTQGFTSFGQAFKDNLFACFDDAMPLES